MNNEEKRVLILGCSGSGKSTLTRFICKKYKLPPVHLDIHFWKPNWTETPLDEWREEVRKLTSSKEWVMDGTFSESFDIRFPLADRIIIIELPQLVCLYRAIKRFVKYSKKNRRSDMAKGCDETFDLGFYKYILTYNRKVLPKIYEAIEKYDCQNKVIFLTSIKEIDSFKRSLK